MTSRGVLAGLLLLNIHAACALSWDDLWTTPGRKAEKLMQQKQYQKAAELFPAGDWRGAALYRAGDYEQAAENFEQSESADGFYNLGNALARMGQYQKAVAAYDNALQKDPAHEDARFNRDLVAALLKESSSPNNAEGDKKENSGQEDKQQDNQNSDQTGQAPSNDSQPPQDSGDHKNESSAQSENKEKPKSEPESEQKASDALKQQKADHQEASQWLQLVPDDPGGLLREKLLRDYLKRHPGEY